MVANTRVSRRSPATTPRHRSVSVRTHPIASPNGIAAEVRCGRPTIDWETSAGLERMQAQRSHAGARNRRAIHHAMATRRVRHTR